MSISDSNIEEFFLNREILQNLVIKACLKRVILGNLTYYTLNSGWFLGKASLICSRSSRTSLKSTLSPSNSFCNSYWFLVYYLFWKNYFDFNKNLIKSNQQTFYFLITKSFHVPEINHCFTIICLYSIMLILRKKIPECWIFPKRFQIFERLLDWKY